MIARVGLLLAVVLLLAGCPGYSYQPQNIDEALKLIEKTEGSGCSYVRIRSLSYVDASVLSVHSYGKDAPKYDVCMKSMPEAARALTPTTLLPIAP